MPWAIHVSSVGQHKLFGILYRHGDVIMSHLEIERAAQQKARRRARAQAFELIIGAAVLVTVISLLSTAA